MAIKFIQDVILDQGSSGNKATLFVGHINENGEEAAFGNVAPGNGTLSISNTDNNYLTIFGKDGGSFTDIDGTIVLKDYGLGNNIHNSSGLTTAKYYLGISNQGKLIEIPLNINLEAVTPSSNTHTIDFNSENTNYSISATNATNTIAFSNLGSADIGKQGNIVITNPSSVGSLSYAALPNTAYTPGGSTISFNTTADAIAVLTYMVVASNKVLVNYVGEFKQYGT